MNLSKDALTILESRYLIRVKKGKVVEKPKELFIRVSNVWQMPRTYLKTVQKLTIGKINFTIFYHR